MNASIENLVTQVQRNEGFLGLFAEHFIAEFLTSLFFTLLAFVFRRKIFDWIKHMLANALNLGVQNVYPNQALATEDIGKSLKSAKKIKILTHRGQSLFEPGAKLIRDIMMNLNENTETELLLIDPDPKSSPSFAELRGVELSMLKNKAEQECVAAHLSDIRTHIVTAVDWSKKARGRKLLLHNTPAVFRMTMTERECYLMFFSGDARGENLPVYRCRSTSELYKCFERYFDFIRDHYSYIVPGKYLGNINTYQNGAVSSSSKSKLTVLSQVPANSSRGTTSKRPLSPSL